MHPPCSSGSLDRKALTGKTWDTMKWWRRLTDNFTKYIKIPEIAVQQKTQMTTALSGENAIPKHFNHFQTCSTHSFADLYRLYRGGASRAKLFWALQGARTLHTDLTRTLPGPAEMLKTETSETKIIAQRSEKIRRIQKSRVSPLFDLSDQEGPKVGGFWLLLTRFSSWTEIRTEYLQRKGTSKQCTSLSSLNVMKSANLRHIKTCPTVWFVHATVFVPGDLEKSWVSEHVGAICLAQTQETFGGFGIIMYHTVSYEFIIYIYIELYDDSVWIWGIQKAHWYSQVQVGLLESGLFEAETCWDRLGETRTIRWHP